MVAIKILSIIIFIVSIIVPIIMNYVFDEDSNGDKRKYIPKKYTVITAAIALIVFVLSSSFVIIPTGYSGVRITFGQIDDTTVQNGFNWKIPFIQSVSKVNNKQQDLHFKDDKIWSETKSRTAIYYEGITVTYQINPEKSAWIYANVSNYNKNLVSSNIVSSSIKSSSKSLNDTDATNRSIVEPLSAKNLQKSLDEKYGKDVILINKITIENVEFEESYNKAIAAKQKAQLEAEKQSIDNKKAIEKAEADAKVKIANAQAEADAKLIKSQAEAKANSILEKSLTDKILKQRYIEKWNGALPNIVTGDSGTSIMVSP